jgi:tRNA-Thr(GGU) m(6)t(6)A37 methyltransferase TsaA
MRPLTVGLTVLALLGIAGEMRGSAAEEEKPMTNETRYQLDPVGRVGEDQGRTFLEIEPELVDAIDGLEPGRSIWVFWWFDRNDTPEKRAILKVHPRGDQSRPLRGVFATRSPVRPNLIAMTLCKIVGIEGSRIEVEAIDAFRGTPILDIKPYLDGRDRPQE